MSSVNSMKSAWIIYIVDIDECSEHNGNCSQHCMNTPGSYEWFCDKGLVVDPSDGKTCEGSVRNTFNFTKTF